MNQETLPNATAVLVLGILSLVTCVCYGIPGMICGAIALFLYSKDKKLYLQEPQLYFNYSNLKTGKILAIVGIVLSVLWLAFLIFYIYNVIGVDALSDPDLLEERMRELQEN